MVRDIGTLQQPDLAPSSPVSDVYGLGTVLQVRPMCWLLKHGQDFGASVSGWTGAMGPVHRDREWSTGAWNRRRRALPHAVHTPQCPLRTAIQSIPHTFALLCCDRDRVRISEPAEGNHQQGAGSRKNHKAARIRRRTERKVRSE